MSKQFNPLYLAIIVSLIPLRIKPVRPEVNQHTVWHMSKVHVVEKLFPMLFIHKVNSLQLKDDVIIDNEIHSVSLVKFHLIPVDRQFNLPFYLEPLKFQKIFKSRLISRLQ